MTGDSYAGIAENLLRDGVIGTRDGCKKDYIASAYGVAGAAMRLGRLEENAVDYFDRMNEYFKLSGLENRKAEGIDVEMVNGFLSLFLSGYRLRESFKRLGIK